MTSVQLRKRRTWNVSGDLLDVNVWVALYAADHDHHAAARQYWRDSLAPSRLFCRLTTMALLRLISNPSVMGDETVRGSAALMRLDEALNTDGVRLVTEPHDLDKVLSSLASDMPISAADWTDAYLATFAIAGNYRMVTFNRGFQRFTGLGLLLLE
jgi:toxin-antitoxin system PIN domain toxin